MTEIRGGRMQNSEIVKFIEPVGFIPDLKSLRKEDLFDELLNPLVAAGTLKSKHIVKEILLKRETLGSTGIGKGVAIPHCRTLAVSAIHVVVGISEQGIPYQAIDNRKVHLCFLIVAPPHDESNLYLPLLGKIVELVHDSKKRRALIKVDDYASLIKVIRGG